MNERDSIQPFKVKKLSWGTEEYRRIKAWQARNYDGTPSNWEPGTPAGERDCIENKFIPADPQSEIRYTNYWQAT